MRFSPAFTLLLCLASACTHANDDRRDSQIHALYDRSGVEQQLETVFSIVQSESLTAIKACKKQDKRSWLNDEYDGTVKRLLSVDNLRADFLERFNERLTETQLADTVAFSESTLGQLVYIAESDSAELSEPEFESLLKSLNDEGAFDNRRLTVIRDMLKHSGAVYFVSAFQTEISSLVSITSLCSLSEENIDQAEIAIREERKSEAFYRSFLRGQMLKPAGVVYRELTNKDLEAVSDFATSDSGNAYYSALIQGVRDVLSEQVTELTEVLKQKVAN